MHFRRLLAFHEDLCYHIKYNGSSLINDEILKECLDANAHLVALFGDLETYMEFMMKKQEKRIKQGVKYVDLPIVRVKKPEKPEV
ncbi:hypothetical protein C6499_14075 [Candidatus Poribacteria bacterium]|nr:MAG: hypothetical protein C6499_14075 [Candidatus Poribacteria bacterium]